MLHCAMVAILAIRSDCRYKFRIWCCLKSQDCHHGHHLWFWNWTIQQFWISMSPRCHQVSAQSDLLFGRRCDLKNFKMAAILDIGTEGFKQFWITITPQCLPSCLSSSRLTVWQEMWFKDFHDGCHGGNLGYQNRTILAILNLHAAPMPSTKFPLHPTYCSGADNNWRLSNWPKEMLIEDFQNGWHGSHLGYRNGQILAILNLHVAPMPPTKFGLNLTEDSGADVVLRFWRWSPRWPSAILDSQTERFKQFWISVSLQCFSLSFSSIQLTV